MARDCDGFRTELQKQTNFFEPSFLKTYTPWDSDVLGRHDTGVWQTGTGDTHYVDRMDIGYPDLTNRWQPISSADCTNACSPPEVGVSMGSERSSYTMAQLDLKGPLFCLTQLEQSTKPGEQFRAWIDALRKLPAMYDADFIRSSAVMYHDAVQIVDDRFDEFIPDPTDVTGNITGQLTTIDLGAEANLPQSKLTWKFIQRYVRRLAAEGYSQDSGLSPLMYNILTNERTWYDLTNGNGDMKAMFNISDYKDASPLYKIGLGVDVPFGNLAPTISNTPLMFQHAGNGVLQRLYPQHNIAGTTGRIRQVNDPYINARYTISLLWHPKAVKVWTPAGGKIHDLIPTINSSMFGKWKMINPQETNFSYTSEDGTVCVYNNDMQRYFYWKAPLRLGFQYKYPRLVTPLLHQVDSDCVSNQPACGTLPQYVQQDYSNNPDLCEA